MHIINQFINFQDLRTILRNDFRGFFFFLKKFGYEGILDFFFNRIDYFLLLFQNFINSITYSRISICLRNVRPLEEFRKFIRSQEFIRELRNWVRNAVISKKFQKRMNSFLIKLATLGKLGTLGELGTQDVYQKMRKLFKKPRIFRNMTNFS